jgi:GTP-binding protein
MGDHAPPPQGGLSPEEIEAGRLLFAQECRFLAGAAAPEAMPPGTLPEVAFAGRSNVGKSSLVNALTGRTTLARTSHTPGRTQQLNFFELGRRLMLVDMPGYGYAEASKAEVKRWQGMVRLYLKGRVGLRRALVLVDARHGLKSTDMPWLEMLDETAVSYQVVLTKADKVKEAAFGKLLAATQAALAKHPAAHPVIAVTSAHEARGIPELRAALAALAAPVPAQ